MKLQFSIGYLPQFDQVSRILKYLLDHQEQSKISRIEMSSVLGIPANQVKGYYSQMKGFGLVGPSKIQLTLLGKTIVQFDPYFEKLDTLWILHYQVSSNPEWVVWHRTMNQAIRDLEELTIKQVGALYFEDLKTEYSEKTIQNNIPQELGTVLGAYTRTSLAKLNILTQEKTGVFLRSEPVELSPLAFLYALFLFREKSFPGSSAVNVADLVHTENSPGKVFYLDEYQVRTLLGQLHDMELIRMEQFGNLDQVRIASSLNEETILTRIYRGK